MTSLYEITTDIKQRIDEMLEQDDLPQATVETWLAEVKGEALQKQTNVAAYVLNLESDIEQMKLHADKIDDKIKASRKRVERLKESLLMSMEVLGQDKVDCQLFALKIKNNPPKVNVNNEDLIPEEFMRVKIIREPDLNKIKDELKKECVDEDGVISQGCVPGCNLVQGKKLEIK